MAVELDKREDDVEECVACAPLPFADFDGILLADDCSIFVVSDAVVAIDGYVTINPKRQSIDELPLALCQLVRRFCEFYNVLRPQTLDAKDVVVLVDYNLGKNEHRCTLGSIVIVAHVVHGGNTVYNVEN